PLTPRTSASHDSCTVLPSGVIAPIPVTTARRSPAALRGGVGARSLIGADAVFEGRRVRRAADRQMPGPDHFFSDRGLRTGSVNDARTKWRMQRLAPSPTSGVHPHWLASFLNNRHRLNVRLAQHFGAGYAKDSF